MSRRPVLVEWMDSCHWSPGTWVDLDPLEHDEASACDVVTVAFLVQETDDALVLAQSITEANDGTGMFVIPKSCVRSVRELRAKKSKAHREFDDRTMAHLRHLAWQIDADRAGA